VLARYINDHRTPLGYNCEFQWLGDRAFVVALRDVVAGEELFVDYGFM
jgi:SET domain-containing protein